MIVIPIYSLVNMTVEQLFDPCMNLKASAYILSRNYQGAKNRYGEGQQALQAALSAYNTGSFSRGFNNGYVRKVLASAGSNTEQVTLKVPKLDPNYSTKSVPAKVKVQTTGGNKPPKKTIVTTENTSSAAQVNAPQRVEKLRASWLFAKGATMVF